MFCHQWRIAAAKFGQPRTTSYIQSARPPFTSAGPEASHALLVGALALGESDTAACMKQRLRRGFGAGADFLPPLRALLRIENFLAQANGLGGDFYVLIVGNELDRLFERHFPRWN